jgi:acetyl/propionyl-CoA carboxylase alpha subunit/acetyl-CoA carboxylase carboxyltransferase component
VRVMRAAAGLGIPTVAVFSEDDAQSLHVRRADEARPLRGRGAAAYLDIDELIEAAKASRCDALHPGYGFLSEKAELASRCESEGIAFIGPAPETLEALGDKARARALAERLGVPVLPGLNRPVSAAEALAFFDALPEGAAMVIKAVGGGGGRGMRVVARREDLEDAFARCRSEALQAFGNGDVYVEEFMAGARHVEVQVVGDGRGGVSHLWERDCTLQRRHQKLVEVAPSPFLANEIRERLLADAVRMAEALTYRSLGTFEFLVRGRGEGGVAAYAFIEANARLQVEHTITEEVLGFDLVISQLRLARGESLADLGLEQAFVPAPRGYAIQARVNMETLEPDGSLRPSGGTLVTFEPPSGPGVRVDTAAYAGYRSNPSFDSLLAKVVGYSPTGFSEAASVAYRALCEFNVAGVRTNIPLLQNLLRDRRFLSGDFDTQFLEENLKELVSVPAAAHPKLFFEQGAVIAGARVDPTDPLAVLAYGKTAESAAPRAAGDVAVPEGMVAVRTPMQATVVSIDVEDGDVVRRGQQLLVLNAMKMEHVISAPVSGVVRRVFASVGDSIPQDVPLIFIEEQEIEDEGALEVSEEELDRLRADLAEVERRRALTTDEARPAGVAMRHEKSQRTAQENIADLCDPGTFIQYGSLVVGQGLAGTIDELLGYAPADGMVMGLGQVNGDTFGPEKSRCVVMSYDYTVLAGTQGGQNHRMIDRMFEVTEKLRVPLIFFAEGGGGRAGGGSRAGATVRAPAESGGGGLVISGGGGLGIPSWHKIGRLSGLVPTVGIVSGRCFAGNAALLGCCDVIIATEDSSIGMGGPAMIEGGGLGVYRPEEVGPLSVQSPNGVVDIPVKDEAEAVAAAKRYLSYFQGRLERWEVADQRILRHMVPENRLRVYDVRKVIGTIADADSVVELRRDFGKAMITALVRIEGRPLGVIANNPMHLSGAIDSPAADKAARFMQLCDAFDLPLLFLCDTPGIMVGPEAEKTALVRHANRMFVVGASITVPTFTVILRKAYGLGAQTMGGGNHKLPIFTIAWPTGEFGGMGIEGQVKLGRRRELEAIDDPEERRQRFERYVAQAYDRGKALNAAHVFEVEDVIDPADTRRWLRAGLLSAPQPLPRDGKKRPCIDTW